eukprot:2185999-Prymnesium_polylepis.1
MGRTAGRLSTVLTTSTISRRAGQPLGLTNPSPAHARRTRFSLAPPTCRSQEWLEAQRTEWEGARRRRSMQEEQKRAAEALPTMLSDGEWEEWLKREWLRKLKDDHDARLGARKRNDTPGEAKANEPSDRE